MTDTDARSGHGSEGRGRKDSARGNVFSRLALFIRQVIAELRKVIWPTRKELVAYTTVVVVFVLVMAGIIAAFDYVFTKGVLFVFG
ncbi:MAG: preprotein translocase subunit SecE [Actinomycetales bacterium]|nr:preprotein translocase subunit SecE [Actinomycetales bacterium]